MLPHFKQVVIFLLLFFTTQQPRATAAAANSDSKQANNNNNNNNYNKINDKDSTMDANADSLYELDYYEPILNFTIPKTDPNNACIRMEVSILFVTTYPVHLANGSLINRTVEFQLLESDNVSYTGYCQPEKSVIEVAFLNDWRLELYFNKLATTFLFNHVVLYYKLSGMLFPDSMHNGAQAEVYEVAYINSTLHRLFECRAGVRVELGEITMYLRNVRVEPFFNKRPNTPFDPEAIASCLADRPPANDDDVRIWLISISVFFTLLLLCCFLFVYLKCKNPHRVQLAKGSFEYDAIGSKPHTARV